jgi:hypothetical protein
MKYQQIDTSHATGCLLFHLPVVLLDFFMVYSPTAHWHAA